VITTKGFVKSLGTADPGFDADVKADVISIAITEDKIQSLPTQYCRFFSRAQGLSFIQERQKAARISIRSILSWLSYVAVILTG
jgi:hypothetical protein